MAFRRKKKSFKHALSLDNVMSSLGSATGTGRCNCGYLILGFGSSVSDLRSYVDSTHREHVRLCRQNEELGLIPLGEPGAGTPSGVIDGLQSDVAPEAEHEPDMPLPEASGQWLIDELVDEAFLTGQALSEQEEHLLRTSLWDLSDEMRPALFDLNNRLVPLARQRMERAKAMGQPTIRTRPDLVLPSEWNLHYLNVHSTELPWLISGIMQNAMMNNALAGESTPWTST